MLRKLVRILFNRNTLIIFLLLLQLVLLGVAILLLHQNFVGVSAAVAVMNVAVVIYICNTSENPSYKLPWLIAMMVFPVFASLAYLLVKTDAGHRKFRRSYERRMHETRRYLLQNPAAAEQLHEKMPQVSGLAQYLMNYGGYPVYRNHEAVYYEDGASMFAAMKEEIRKAKRYVFLEFFIISKGRMWDELLDVLREKAAEGVDIRLMYDGFGTQFMMPRKYFSDLAQYGISTRVFNRFKPFLSTSQNNRDHRKLVIIDGMTAFTGGVNIADEYINIRSRFGHWKDGGMMCRGEAAWSFSVMFLQLWDLEKTDEGELEIYRPAGAMPCNYDGFIQPYSDSPTDEEYVGRCVYLDIAANAKKYVYIMTPYLIPDHEMITALGLAAKKGVDVRLITPHIPDKWYTYSAAWSYYHELLSEHVRIFEYEPGFVHAKTFLADDEIAVTGTINLDYRSLYLHFECASVLYGTSCIRSIRSDFDRTLASCVEITLDECNRRPFFKRVVSGILRLFAPLL